MSSIRDVAKMANVAACTVSRVLNGTANVSPETRMRIEQAMKELNYIPNELARGMFRQKAGIVAMLVPNIRHPYFSSLATFIEDELYKNGYKLMLCSTGDDVEREKDYLKILKSNIVDGVIMGVNNQKPEDYEQFEKPLVMLDYFVNKDIPLVVSDHATGGRLAAEEFIASGCSYVLHIGNEAETERVISYESHKVLQETLEASGIPSRELDIKWNTFDFQGYLELAKLILEKHPEIDGIMAADMPAAAFMKAAFQLGKRIPEDLCIVSYDGTFVANTNLIELTTIHQSLQEIGRVSVSVMMKLLQGEKLEETYIRIPVKIKKGGTTIKKD
ncbi:MAG: LacI family DNA-binding transcriptional regulator [Eubacteriales bacterium]|nr:LacI family DNA-binding transcriptional regulator [Eubacteriales bacterium]